MGWNDLAFLSFFFSSLFIWFLELKEGMEWDENLSF